jgi:hypothetical protein
MNGLAVFEYEWNKGTEIQQKLYFLRKDPRTPLQLLPNQVCLAHSNLNKEG